MKYTENFLMEFQLIILFRFISSIAHLDHPTRSKRTHKKLSRIYYPVLPKSTPKEPSSPSANVSPFLNDEIIEEKRFRDSHKRTVR